MGKKFLLIGTDKRQKYLLENLKRRGHFAELLDDIDKAVVDRYDAILLPVTDSKYYYEKIKDRLNKQQYVFGCNLEKKNNMEIAAAEAEQSISHAKIIEYMGRKQTAVKNAAATAEGAIAEAIINSDVNICGSKSLVLGYGICGRQIADRLSALHSSVSVIESDKILCAEAEARGFSVVAVGIAAHLQKTGKKYKFIFNTIPQIVLDKKVLSMLSLDVTIIDIASKPGGVDYEYCKNHNIRAVHALGLPGKYSPETSAEILLNVIEKTML